MHNIQQATQAEPQHNVLQTVRCCTQQHGMLQRAIPICIAHRCQQAPYLDAKHPCSLNIISTNAHAKEQPAILLIKTATVHYDTQQKLGIVLLHINNNYYITATT